MIKPNINFPLRDLGFSNAVALDEHPRHRWYFVKESFSPKLVVLAIANDGVKRGEILFDPFSGSGTVPLTGALEGLKTRGFEINPFLHFLSATKLRQVSPAVYRSASHKILLAMEKQIPSPLEGYSTFTEGNRFNRWLFPRPVIRSFEAGRKALMETNIDIHDLLKLAMIGAAMDCCNASRDGKCLRYTGEWQNNQATASHFRHQFEIRSATIESDLGSAPLKDIDANVNEGDARKLIMDQSSEKFNICVTSPPYLNSFDYSDIYRPELFLGGFVDSNKTLMDIRLKTLRSHIQASWERPTKDQFGILYKNCIDGITEYSADLWNPRIPTMIQAYFEDMETMLRGMRKRAHPRASAWLVVSTSAYAGIEVPVDLILAEIGQRCGWFLREVGVLRHLRSSSQHFRREGIKSVPLRESVVIFDASKSR